METSLRHLPTVLCAALASTFAFAHVSVAQATHAHAHAATAPKAFEGPITYEITPDHGPIKDITYLVKGSKIRFEVPQTNSQYESDDKWQVPKDARRFSDWGTMTQINDAATGEILDFISGWNQYIRTVPKADTGAAAKKVVVEPPHLGVVKTGAKETIAGISCDDYTIVDSTRTDTTATICVASGMGFVMGLDGPVSNATPIEFDYTFAKQHFKNGFLPLKYVNVVNGQPHGQIVVTSISRQTLPASNFVPNPEWREWKPSMYDF